MATSGRGDLEPRHPGTCRGVQPGDEAGPGGRGGAGGPDVLVALAPEPGERAGRGEGFGGGAGALDTVGEVSDPGVGGAGVAFGDDLLGGVAEVADADETEPDRDRAGAGGVGISMALAQSPRPRWSKLDVAVTVVME